MSNSVTSGQNESQRPEIGTIAAGSHGALDDLVVFVNVALQLSFGSAAKRLKLPSTNVSRAVARLEERLGVKLLQRSSRSVQLTVEGRQLLLSATTHLEGLDEALASTSEQGTDISGVIRVTAPAYTGATRIAQLLGEFAEAHPGVIIDLDASNAFHDLIQDGFDFAVRVGGFESTDIVVRRLWQGHFGLFATRELAQRAWGGAALDRAVLESAPCLVLRTSASWQFRDLGGAAVTIKPNARFAVNDPRAAIELARRGLGVVLAPVEAAEQAPELVRLTTTFGEPAPIDLFIVYPSRRLLPRRVRLAINWLVDASFGEGD